MDGVLGLHHVAICVDELDTARRFYVDVLGFTERSDRPDFGFPGAWLDIAGEQVHLMEVAEMPAGAARQHFAVRVTDLDAAVGVIEAHGVRVYRADYTPGAGHQAFVQDPAGNGIELNQPD